MDPERPVVEENFSMTASKIDDSPKREADGNSRTEHKKPQTACRNAQVEEKNVDAEGREKDER